MNFPLSSRYVTLLALMYDCVHGVLPTRETHVSLKRRVFIETL